MFLCQLQVRLVRHKQQLFQARVQQELAQHYCLVLVERVDRLQRRFLLAQVVHQTQVVQAVHLLQAVEVVHQLQRLEVIFRLDQAESRSLLEH